MAFGGILPGEQDIERIGSWITAENLQDAVKKYLNTEKNCYCFSGSRKITFLCRPSDKYVSPSFVKSSISNV